MFDASQQTDLLVARDWLLDHGVKALLFVGLRDFLDVNNSKDIRSSRLKNCHLIAVPGYPPATLDWATPLEDALVDAFGTAADEKCRYFDLAKAQWASCTPLQLCCLALHALGIHTVTASYDGLGDSGAVEDWHWPVEPPTLHRAWLEQLLEEDLSERRLPPGWEINDGSYGEATLGVNECCWTIEHAWRATTDDGFSSGDTPLTPYDSEESNDDDGTTEVA
jgi:hypothetical protein